MSAEPERPSKSLLIRAYECKNRPKINVQEFIEIVRSEAKLTKLSEKGLFILCLCEILLKAYMATGLKIRNFITEFDRKEVKKRQKREGGGQTRKRRKPNKNENQRGQRKTLEELSNQSISNPSNVERPRANDDKPADSANQKDPLSKQKGEDSNGSKQHSGQNQLKIQLNKITEQLRAQQDTFVPDVDFFPGGTTLDQNSQTSSSQSGQISNLSEKIKIFTNVKETERRGTTTRRKTGNNGNLTRETRTKKKKFQIFDHSTFIEETRVSENDISLNYTEVSRFEDKDALDFDLVKNFIHNLGINQKQLQTELFQKDKIDLLKSVFQNEGITMYQNNDTFGDGGMMNNDETYDLQLPDYTMSQPTSAPMLQPDFFKQSLEIKDSQFDFSDLVKRSSKDKATLFYQLLWRQQNQEITLFQKSPQTFSSIKVKHR